MYSLADNVAIEFEVVAAIAGILLVIAVMLWAVRARNLPVCWNCGYHSVRRAHSRRGLDALANGFFLFPHRCEKCLERFYCFGIRRVRHSTGRTMAAADGRS